MKALFRLAPVVVFPVLVLLPGCFHRKHSAPQQQTQAPAATTPGVVYPPPVTTTAPEPLPQTPPETAQTAPPQQTTPPPAKPRPKKKTKPSPSIPADAGSTATTPAGAPSQGTPAAPPSPQQQAAAGTPIAGDSTAAPSAIGQLASSDEASDPDKRKNTVDLISSTEQSLNGIKRQLSAEEQKTAAQIRTFIAQARQAIRAQDLDGAHTLATKAKLLLDELKK